MAELNDPVEGPDLGHLNIEEKDTVRGNRGARESAGRKGRSRGGAGGGGSSGQGREMQISKALSLLLRHKAESEGIPLDGEGFASVDQVLKWNRLKSLHATFADIKIAVSDNAKQRFALRPLPAISTPDLTSTTPSDWVIRANQGHTIIMDSAALHTPLTLSSPDLPEVVIHGTFFYFYPLILSTGGLKRMGRNHIHFSTGLPSEGNVISGMRGDAEVVIYVDIRKALADGIVWWRSENGVVLTAGGEDGMLATKYWIKAEGRRQNVGVLWEDGNAVAELPEELKGRRAPRGKEAVDASGESSRRKNADAGKRGSGRGRGGGRGKEYLEGGGVVGSEIPNH